MSSSLFLWLLIGYAFLAAGLLLSVIFDIRYRRVPNLLVLALAFAGLLLNSFALPPGSGLMSDPAGPVGIYMSLLSSLFALLLTVPFWLFRALGAGDVKLFAAVGSFTGPGSVPDLLLFVSLAGGVFAILYAIFAGNFYFLLRNISKLFWRNAFMNTRHSGPWCQTAWRMPYAVAIAGGVAAYSWWTLSGREPILSF